MLRLSRPLASSTRAPCQRHHNSTRPRYAQTRWRGRSIADSQPPTRVRSLVTQHNRKRAVIRQSLLQTSIGKTITATARPHVTVSNIVIVAEPRPTPSTIPHAARRRTTCYPTRQRGYGTLRRVCSHTKTPQHAHRNRHGNNLHADPGHLPHVSARQQKRRFPIIRATPQASFTINSSIQTHIQVIVNNDPRLVQPLRNAIRQSTLHMRTALHERQLGARSIQDERASGRKQTPSSSRRTQEPSSAYTREPASAPTVTPSPAYTVAPLSATTPASLSTPEHTQASTRTREPSHAVTDSNGDSTNTSPETMRSRFPDATSPSTVIGSPRTRPHQHNQHSGQTMRRKHLHSFE